jgi:hypothetical protein
MLSQSHSGIGHSEEFLSDYVEIDSLNFGSAQHSLRNYSWGISIG